MKRKQYELYIVNEDIQDFEYIITLKNKYKLNDLLAVLDEDYKIVEV